MNEKKDAPLQDDHVAAMRREHEERVEKVRRIAVDYVESILAGENEMDLAVIRYLLNDLLPLKEVHLPVDEIVATAVRDRDLPWVLEQQTWRRVGERVEVRTWEAEKAERHVLDMISRITMDCVAGPGCIEINKLATELASRHFTMPRGETVESLLEKAIAGGHFKGYIDLVAGQVHRDATSRERYQQQFLSALDTAASTLRDNGPAGIPVPIESLLASPDAPRSLDGLLDTAEARAKDIQEFIVTFVQKGRRVSLGEIDAHLHEHFKERHVDLPWEIKKDGIEAMLERMVRDNRIQGHFEDDAHFVRDT